MRIYLAGPDVFLLNPIQQAEGLKSVCGEFGLTGVFPLDAELHLDGLKPPEQGRAIFDANVDLIRSCHAVLANMTPFRGPSMDVGTAWEMGFAHALKLPIMGYTTDPQPYPKRVAKYRHLIHVGFGNPSWHEGLNNFDDPAFVEDFGLHDNLMLDCSTAAIYPSFREAAESLGRSLRAYPPRK